VAHMCKRLHFNRLREGWAVQQSICTLARGTKAGAERGGKAQQLQLLLGKGTARF